MVLIASIFIKISGPCWILSFCSECSPNVAFIYVTYVTNYLSLFHFQKLFSTMPYSERKTGKFCHKSVIDKYKPVQQANSNHCVNSQNEDNLNSFNHGHSYITSLSYTDEICDQEIKTYEEEIGTQDLPKGVVSLDKYRLVVELQIILNQLKSGCKDCRLPLNLCHAQGVLPRGLGGWLYIFCVKLSIK